MLAEKLSVDVRKIRRILIVPIIVMNLVITLIIVIILFIFIIQNCTSPLFVGRWSYQTLSFCQSVSG